MTVAFRNILHITLSQKWNWNVHGVQLLHFYCTQI